MRKLSRYTDHKVEPNTTRLKRVFAFLPTRVNGYTLWLEYYEILQAYVEQPYKLKVEGKEVAFLVGGWINVSKRLIN